MVFALERKRVENINTDTFETKLSAIVFSLISSPNPSIMKSGGK
jgi:hypothetical protein